MSKLIQTLIVTMLISSNANAASLSGEIESICDDPRIFVSDCQRDIEESIWQKNKHWRISDARQNEIQVEGWKASLAH